MAKFKLVVSSRTFEDEPRAGLTVTVTTTPKRYPVAGLGVIETVKSEKTSAEGLAEFDLLSLPGLYYVVSIGGESSVNVSGHRSAGEVVRLDTEVSVTPSPIPATDAASLRAELLTLIDGIQFEVGSVDWEDILKKPALFDPVDHTHMMDQVVGLESALANLQTAIGSKASEAEMAALFTTLIGTAPAALDTLGELADRLANEGDAVAALTSLVGDLQALVDTKADGEAIAAALAGKVNTSDFTLALSGKANTSHNHDASYYTKAQSDAKYALVGSTGGSGVAAPSTGADGGWNYDFPGTTFTMPAGIRTEDNNATWADRLSLGPMVVRRAFSFTSVSVQVWIPNATATQLRVGLYRYNKAVSRFERVYDFGVVDATSDGTKTLPFSGSLTPGLYYVATSANTSAGSHVVLLGRLPVDILVPTTYALGYGYSNAAPIPAEITYPGGDTAPWAGSTPALTFAGVAWP